MVWLLVKGLVSGGVIVGVSLIAQRSPRYGALLLTLPIVSILAFVVSWRQSHDLNAISRMARETLILVPLGMPFFVPLAFADSLGIGFWAAAATGVLISVLTIGCWLAFGAGG